MPNLWEFMEGRSLGMNWARTNSLFLKALLGRTKSKCSRVPILMVDKACWVARGNRGDLCIVMDEEVFNIWLTRNKKEHIVGSKIADDSAVRTLDLLEGEIQIDSDNTKTKGGSTLVVWGMSSKENSRLESIMKLDGEFKIFVVSFSSCLFSESISVYLIR